MLAELDSVLAQNWYIDEVHLAREHPQQVLTGSAGLDVEDRGSVGFKNKTVVPLSVTDTVPVEAKVYTLVFLLRPKTSGSSQKLAIEHGHKDGKALRLYLPKSTEEDR
jgi:hypothetical protein